MAKIEPHQSWYPLDAAAAAEPDPRKRTLLEAVRDHMHYEITGQLDALMSTLTAEPFYHFWGNGDPMVIEGWDAVRGFYANMMAVGGQQFEVVVERIVVDANMVVTEGRVKQVYQPAALKAMGITAVKGVPVDDAELWLSDAQLVTLWPADAEGKLMGEDIYFGQNPMETLTPIERSDLPDYYELKTVAA